MLIEGFYTAIVTSMEYLQENMSEGVAPLFAAELELKPPDTAYTPSLLETASDGFYELIEGLLEDIYDMAKLIDRVSTSENTYRDLMSSNEDLTDLRGDIISRVYDVMKAARNYAADFDEYGHLWNDDRAEFLSQFLTYGHILTAEEIEAAGTDPIPENPPTLTQFREQIDSYEDLYAQISGFSDINVFHDWFRVSIRPFKHALLNIIKKWSLMFKDHLIHHVENSLEDLQGFIASTQASFKAEFIMRIRILTGIIGLKSCLNISIFKSG